MTAQPYKDSKENQAQAQQITFNMLSGMLEVLNELERARLIDAAEEAEKDAQIDFFRRDTQRVNFADPVRRRTHSELEAELEARPPSAALPLEYISDNASYDMPEHRAIMTPNNDLEGIYAIKAHLGEGIRNSTFVAWNLNDKGKWQIDKFMTGAEGLTQLERIIYDESAMTAQGDAVVPHENRKPRLWFQFAAGIQRKLSCTTEQAETLELAFRTLDTTPKMAKEFEKWLKTEGKFNAGYRWFQDIAKEMVLCTDEGEPSIITDSYIETDDADDANVTIDADHPADIIMLSAGEYHKLDDPRDADFDEEKNMTSWEKRQPAIFNATVRNIKSCKTLAELKTIGQALFNDKRFNKTQASVIWGAYNRRKKALSPKLRPLALKALDRMADPKVNLAAVAAWLHGDGKKKLNAYEASIIWDCWKKAKAAKAPKQTDYHPEY
jgi:hypothetical protein